MFDFIVYKSERRCVFMKFYDPEADFSFLRRFIYDPDPESAHQKSILNLIALVKKAFSLLP